MPIKHGSSKATVRANIRELKKGPQYAETKRTHGAAKANAQAVAIAMDEARKSRGKK